ncbi:MAG TPA: sigma-70 family RNA polymerase sigma factor [Bacilli bacterium]|nr:sigma-70 family RNA polymerase sigma factor [Bacilli bacterium]
MEDLAQLVLDNEPLIYSVVNKYGYYDRDDLYQVGVMGLIKAQKNYKFDKDTKFSSYAYFYILGEIKAYIKEQVGVKVSRDIQKLNLMIEKATILLAQKLLKYPTTCELSLYLGVEEDKILEARDAKIIIDSLDDDKEDQGLSYYDVLGYEEKMYDESILDLKTELDNLSEFERSLISKRYFDDKTQSEVSKDLGISQVQVSRKEKNILNRLKERL